MKKETHSYTWWGCLSLKIFHTYTFTVFPFTFSFQRESCWFLCENLLYQTCYFQKIFNIWERFVIQTHQLDFLYMFFVLIIFYFTHYYARTSLNGAYCCTEISNLVNTARFFCWWIYCWFMVYSLVYHVFIQIFVCFC